MTTNYAKVKEICDQRVADGQTVSIDNILQECEDLLPPEDREGFDNGRLDRGDDFSDFVERQVADFREMSREIGLIE